MSPEAGATDDNSTPSIPSDANWLERIWERREEGLYPALFGPESEGIFPLSMDSLMKGRVPDPRWTTIGVFRFAPTPCRDSWLYVSSGLSNAWFDKTPDPAVTSGFGCEFLMETPTKADWPIIRLHQIMIFQLGLCCGKYDRKEPLGTHDRVPLRGSIDGGGGQLTHVILTSPPNFDATLRQDSGFAEFCLLFGITESEREFAMTHGGPALIQHLKEKTIFPITNPERTSVIS